MVKKILVVEDDQFTADLYKKLLEDEGFLVDIAEDGEKGLMKLQLGGYDLCLLDIVMPRKDGLTVLQELKKKPPVQPNGPIVMLTVMGQDAFIKTALENGAAGYLIKTSFTPEQVLHEVRVFLRKAEG